MGQEYYLEYSPPSGGVSWVLGLCKCSHIKVQAEVEWGWDQLEVFLDDVRVINVDADMGVPISVEMNVSPAHVLSRLTVGLFSPAYAGLKNIKVWYTCEAMGTVYYLEYMPLGGGVNFTIGACSCTWVKLEAIAGQGTLARVLLDGVAVIEEYAAMEKVIHGQTDLSPPIPCSQITVALWGGIIAGIKVWYMCEAAPGGGDFETVTAGSYW